MDKLKKVRINKDGHIYEGLLIAKEGDVYIIKLNNGYNIGIKGELEVLEEVQLPSINDSNSSDSGGDVVILGCGGTISSKVDYNTGAVYPAIDPDSLVSQFPELRDIAEITVKNVFSVFSEEMNPKHWAIIAEEVYSALQKGKSVVILHGTDTMHYSSAALSFALQNLSKPVVFTGAQRSSDRPSSDNKLNLLNAVFTATKHITEVGIVMHAQTDDSFAYFIKGTNARKMHSSRRDAFKSINIPPLARVDYKNQEFKQIFIPEYNKDKKDDIIFDNRFNDNVAIVYYYPGMKSEDLEKFLDKDGIVLVGTGLGHVSLNYNKDRLSENLLPAIKKFYDEDKPIVITSQTIYGRVNLNVYSTGRMLKQYVIGNMLNLTPETAYVKLSWVLGHTKGIENVRKEMETNIAGELSRSIASREF